jgi:hypothetical protein
VVPIVSPLRYVPTFEGVQRSSGLAVASTAKKRSDFIVVSDERGEELVTSVQENKSEIVIAATFEKLVS